MPGAPVALLFARDGVLAPGCQEVAAEVASAGTDATRTILVGSDLGVAVAELAGIVDHVELIETEGYRPGAWAMALGPVVTSAAYVLTTAAPVGRDLAPRLSAELEWPLLAGAIHVRADRVTVVRHGGLVQETLGPEAQFVATFQPGVRGVAPTPGVDGVPRVVRTKALSVAFPRTHEAELLEVLPPDPLTTDLAESIRIVGGGAGLIDTDPAARFAQLSAVGAAMGAAMGATRVVTDAGWVAHQRQIGTTGVVVDPRLYLAFAISGAVQHTAGLGHPDHIVSVNLDPHCPMMAMADLAVVADANAVLDALHAQLVPGAPEQLETRGAADA